MKNIISFTCSEKIFFMNFTDLYFVIYFLQNFVNHNQNNFVSTDINIDIMYLLKTKQGR